jgi:hypothetical protein
MIPSFGRSCDSHPTVYAHLAVFVGLVGIECSPVNHGAVSTVPLESLQLTQRGRSTLGATGAGGIVHAAGRHDNATISRQYRKEQMIQVRVSKMIDTHCTVVNKQLPLWLVFRAEYQPEMD